MYHHTPHPALALIIPLLVVFLKRKHIHLFLLPNYKALASNVVCLSTFMFFSPMRNYWSHLRNHFYLSSCVRTQGFCFLTDLAKFYWRFNCDQYVEIQFCYILLKIIDSFLLANSSTAGWALGTREILGLGLDVVIHIKSSGLFRDRTPNPLPWRSCWKMIVDLGRIKIRQRFRSVRLLQNYRFSAFQLPKGITKIGGLHTQCQNSPFPGTILPRGSYSLIKHTQSTVYICKNSYKWGLILNCKFT